MSDYKKQVNLIDIYEFNKRKMPIHVIGCGATGSWVITMLAKMGFKNINIYDFDSVEEHNLPNQNFSNSDIGKNKAKALYDMLEDHQDQITYHETKVTKKDMLKFSGVVLCLVDTMIARKGFYEILSNCKGIDLYIDSRLDLYGAYVYTLPRELKYSEDYEKTLYDDEETEVSICGVSQTGLPASVNCASTIVTQLIYWATEREYYNCIMYQLPDYTHIKEKWQE